MKNKKISDLKKFKEKTIQALVLMGMIVILFDVLTGSKFYILEICFISVACTVFFCMYAVFWRCPNCRKMLPLRGDNFNVCPYCGKNGSQNY